MEDAAAAVVPVAYYRVDRGAGFSLPVVSVRDRRSNGNAPLIRWVYQKHLEIVLFNTYGQNSSVWKLLHQASLGRTTLSCDRAAVNAGLLTDAEFGALLTIFKEALSAELLDPCSRNKIRSFVLVPLAAASAVCRLYGRSEASMAFLRAVSQPIPQIWEMEAQAEADAANGEADLVLLDAIDEHGYEAEQMTFAEELTTEAPFAPTAADETKLKQYALSPVPSILRSELDSYIRHRCATFAAKRSGAAVVSATAEHDTQSLLKCARAQADQTDRPHPQTRLRHHASAIAGFTAGWRASTRSHEASCCTSRCSARASSAISRRSLPSGSSPTSRCGSPRVRRRGSNPHDACLQISRASPLRRPPRSHLALSLSAQSRITSRVS